MTESGKTVVATVLSVLAHVSLFTVLALMPEAPLVPAPPSVAETPEEERPLEVTLETAAPSATPTPALIEPAPAGGQALHTQLDPKNLRRAEQAPEHAKAVAAYNSQAAAGSSSTPLPSPTPPNHSADLALQASKPTPTPGEIGIDALGNYGKAVGNAIGVRSEFYRKAQNPPLAVGEVRVQFVLNAQGRVSEIAVLSNTAGPANAAVARRAVEEAKIPPIPADRLAQLPGGCIRIVYSFSIYPSQ